MVSSIFVMASIIPSMASIVPLMAIIVSVIVSIFYSSYKLWIAKMITNTVTTIASIIIIIASIIIMMASILPVTLIMASVMAGIIPNSYKTRKSPSGAHIYTTWLQPPCFLMKKIRHSKDTNKFLNKHIVNNLMCSSLLFELINNWP